MADTLTTLRAALDLLHPNLPEYADLSALITALESQAPAAIVTEDGFLVESEPMLLKAGDRLYLLPVASMEAQPEPASCDTCKHAANPPSQPPCNGCMDSEDFHFFESDSPFCEKCGSTGSAQPKSEPAHDDLTIAYLSGFHDGKMAKPRAEPVQEPVSAMLKVVRGDICCKSLDMDQSYGMWVPVTYSTEHGFVDGTCFYTTAQPSEPKAEPVATTASRAVLHD